MNLLPKEFLPIILAFAPLFSKPVWESALVLLVGAILAPGKRTVSAVLRVMGLKDEPHFQNYHRVLSRALWSSRHASRILLLQLIKCFAPSGVLVMGIDDTIERRWGKRITARGIYRDPVRSSDSHFVKTSGLRWLSLMLLVPIPWAQRVWALPFFTVLAPSERYHQRQGHRHKVLTDWARQMLTQVRRWLPQRAVILVADSSFAALELLESLRQLSRPVHVVTRLRLDAALYDPAPKRRPKQMGRPRKVGKRLPTLKSIWADPQADWQSLSIEDWYGRRAYPVEVISKTAVWYHTGMAAVPIRWVLVRDPQGHFSSQAFLCTDLSAAPQQIVQWFCQRWGVEVTFAEVRAHLGVETQRQWSNLAILRTTPALFGLFSIVVLLAHHLPSHLRHSGFQAAWYQKPSLTFSDALASVRQRFWQVRLFHTSAETTDIVKVPKALLDCWSSLLCYAA
jgi:DDE superfamily endonuclease